MILKSIWNMPAGSSIFDAGGQIRISTLQNGDIFLVLDTTSTQFLVDKKIEITVKILFKNLIGWIDISMSNDAGRKMFVKIEE